MYVKLIGECSLALILKSELNQSSPFLAFPMQVQNPSAELPSCRSENSEVCNPLRFFIQKRETRGFLSSPLQFTIQAGILLLGKTLVRSEGGEKRWK